jgi:exopolysaccharide biosynthesis polyprenyl glycosylphosphotransferase
MSPLFDWMDHLSWMSATVAFGTSLLAYAMIRLRHPAATERVLLLGSGPLAADLVSEMQERATRWSLVGVIAESDAAKNTTPGPVVGSLEDLDSAVRRLRPDRIVVALDQLRGRLPLRTLLESRVHGVRVERGATFYERLVRKLPLDALTPSAMIFSGGFQRRRFDWALGRGVSLLVASLGLVLTAPLFVLIALAIRLDSRGRVLFAQERVGREGRIFPLFKFRTMHAKGANGSLWVNDNAFRITRVGGWLRRLHLDELPQFINVLRGDMNLVGPRPHPVSNFRLFNDNIPFYFLRAAVRPGVTGWAQIRYRYANNLEEETEKMRYDLYYIKHRSLWLDLRILFLTARNLLAGGDAEEATAAQAARVHARGAHRAA